MSSGRLKRRLQNLQIRFNNKKKYLIFVHMHTHCTHMMMSLWIITPLIDHHYSSTHLLNRHLFSRHLTQGTERAVLQAPRQTLGVERVRARQPAGAGRVHRGHADAAGRVIVIVRRVRGVPIAPGCGRLLHRNHRSAVRRFARAAAPAIEHHPVQPIAVRAAATRPPRSQVGLDDLPQHDSVFFSVRGNRFDVIDLAGAR